LVTEIIDTTRSMIVLNNQLSQRLTSSVKEASQLKKSLEALKRESTIDHLTKLYNRKWFDTVLDQSKMDSDAQDSPLSLLMIDIDYFKKFNDTYGHQLGDQVLKLVARTITDCVGETDTPARYGGEEFSVILPHCSLEKALEKAESIRKTVAGRKVTNRTTGQVLGQVTLSVGAAQYEPGEPAADLIQRADGALYFAKNNGRNRVASQTDLV
jgi:diguanylate cyclase